MADPVGGLFRVPWIRALAVILLSMAGASECLAGPAAIVLESHGAVWTTPRPTGERRLLTRLDIVAEGDRLQAGPEASAVLFFIASGSEYVLRADSAALAVSDGLYKLSGTEPTRRVREPAREIRLRADELVLGGILMRSYSGVTAASAPPGASCDMPVSPEEAVRRRPDPGAASSERVLYALWLESVCAGDLAQRAWRELLRDFPSDAAIRQRIR